MLPQLLQRLLAIRSVACFVDGHVDLIKVEDAEKQDYVVADGNDSAGALGGYKGLWHRGVAGDLENGFFVECRTDWGNWSGHTHTAGGITEGRDVWLNRNVSNEVENSIHDGRASFEALLS